jgi:hypothetical protein
MVIDTGPPHRGWLVAVGDGRDVPAMAKLAAWVGVTTAVEFGVCSVESGETVEIEEMVVVLGVKVGKSRLGPRGLFHL